MHKIPVLNSSFELFAQAQADIVSVDDWLNKKYTSENIKFGRACYDSAQAVEKLLKGYIRENNIEVFQGHNLNIYLNQAMNINKKFVDILKDCAYLNAYTAEKRYNSDNEIKIKDVIEALIRLNNVFEFSEIRKLYDNFIKNNYFEELPKYYILSVIEKLKKR